MHILQNTETTSTTYCNYKQWHGSWTGQQWL